MTQLQAMPLRWSHKNRGNVDIDDIGSSHLSAPSETHSTATCKNKGIHKWFERGLTNTNIKFLVRTHLTSYHINSYHITQWSVFSPAFQGTCFPDLKTAQTNLTLGVELGPWNSEAADSKFKGRLQGPCQHSPATKTLIQQCLRCLHILWHPAALGAAHLHQLPSKPWH